MDTRDTSNGMLHQGFSIGRFSVTKPVLINILMVTLLALGLFSVIRLPQEQFAEVPFFWVNVIVPYPGASAEDLEASVTIPVENAFQGISKLKRISSTTSEGLSVVRVEFDDGISNTEFQALFQESQTRFSQVALPDGVLTPLVDDFSSADFLPVIEVVISGNLPYELLREEAFYLRDRILKVKDVSDVDIIGLPDRQILVNLDPGRLTSLGLSVNEVIRAIQDQNRVIPSGTLTTGSREYLLRTLGSIKEIEDVEMVIIRRSTTGEGVVRVGDVAEVSLGFDPDSSIARFNGKPSVSLRVTKVPRGSSVAVVSGTREIVDQATAERSSGAQLTLFNDSTVQIASSLSVLTSNAVMGLGLLVIILWLFIGFRNAMMTALGIPVTFAITFLILDLLGETINTNTLFGLVLVLGLIVDHSIVIIENSYRLQQSGLNRHDAAILGTNQVVWPIIAATGTTIAAFLPLMIIPGTIGKFLRVIPLTVTIALIASTGEALFILPSHFADWGRKESAKRKPSKPAGQWFEKVKTGYNKALFSLYRFKGMLLIVLLLIAVGVFGLVGFLNQDLFSAEDYSYFSIDITTPRGTTLAETNRIVSQYEEVLLGKIGNGEFLSISTSIGSLSGSSGGSSNSTVAQITVDLAEQGEGRSRGIDAIMQEVERDTYYIGGAESVFFRKAQTGPPTSAPLSFRFSGDDYTQIINASRAVQNALSTINGVSNIEDDFADGSPELKILLNQERASALGISVSTVGTFLRARFDSITVGTFFQNNEEISIVLRFSEVGGRSFANLEQALIPTDDGRIIPLSSIATIEMSNSLGSIRRLDGKREVTLTANATDLVDLEAVNAQVQTLWDDSLQAQFPDVFFGVGGEFSEFQDLLLDILRVFLLGIFLIYLILGAQFNSYSQPLLILLSVPFAFVGVILYLVSSGTPLSTTVIYAGVALAGIAVNDAIVLISFINELRADGKGVKGAILEAGSTRIRPILLTSITTIVGLLPTAIGFGGYSVVWGPMASTIIFGLLFSTLTALFIIPMLYGVIYDRSPKTKGRSVV
jgi:multidrug efflux pump subunit AcrB